MTTCLGKSCSFDLPCMSFENVYQFAFFPFGLESGVWDLIVIVPDHCLFSLERRRILTPQ